MTRTLVSLSASALAAVGIVVSTTAGCSGTFIPIGDLPDASGGTSSSGSGGGTSSSAGTSSSGVGGSSSGTGSSSTSSGAHGSSSGGHSSSSGAGSGSGSGGISSSSGSGSSSGGMSSSSGTGSSSSGVSSSSGGGSCCPSNWYLYQCSYPDGGSGFACHNPQLGCASSLTCGLGCDPVVTGSCGGGSSSSGGNSSSSGSGSSSSGAGSSSSGGSTGLQWYPTCGPPVQGCTTPDGGLRDDAGAPCPPIGSSCSTANELCGTSSPYGCPEGEICSNQPMRICPVSSRKFKDNVQYVDAAGLQQLHDETLGIRLATYNYKAQIADPNPKHLGFIIEDRPPQSSAIDWSRERVDLYGYLSMVVATMQVQEREIAELRRQLELAQDRAQEQEPVCMPK